MPDHLISAYGGALVDLLVDEKRRLELKAQSREWPSWDLTQRQLCDLELLLTGGFSPLASFMGRRDYESVRDHMRLADGTLWPIPITLDLTAEAASRLDTGSHLALRDPEGVILAVLHVKEIWQADLKGEAEAVYGTSDRAHPSVAALLDSNRPCYVAGELEGLAGPGHYDYGDLRHTPAELRSIFQTRGWRKIVAFQTRNPLHRAHFELTLRAAKQVEANLLIHPVVGMTKPGDVDHYTRVRCYQAIMPSYPPGTAMLSLLPLAMRMGGPREALLHAIIRRNHGVTPPDRRARPRGPGKGLGGPAVLWPVRRAGDGPEHEAELGVQMVPFQEMVYVEDRDAYMPEDEVPKGARVLSISGTEQRRRLNEGPSCPRGSRRRRSLRSCGAPTPRDPSRASRCSSRGCRARASRRSQTWFW